MLQPDRGWCHGSVTSCLSLLITTMKASHFFLAGGVSETLWCASVTFLVKNANWDTHSGQPHLKSPDVRISILMNSSWQYSSELKSPSFSHPGWIPCQSRRMFASSFIYSFGRRAMIVLSENYISSCGSVLVDKSEKRWSERFLLSQRFFVFP